DADRGGAGIEPLGVLRVDEDRPDVGIAARHAQLLELVAAVMAAIDALGAADEDRVVVVGMHGDRVHLRALGQLQLLPFLAAGFLAKDAAERSRVLHPDRGRDADIYVRLSRHRSLLLRRSGAIITRSASRASAVSIMVRASQ